MPQSNLQLDIKGDGVLPHTVDLPDLLDVLAAFVKSVRATTPKGQDKQISLVGVDTGSLIGMLLLSDSAMSGVDRIAAAVRENNADGLPSAARDGLRAIWQSTWRNGWDSCELVGRDASIVTISAESELFPDPLTFKGVTVIHGECLKAGGDQSKSALIKLINGDKLTVRLASKSLAEELGRNLYHSIGLRGVATWSGEKRKLKEFKAESITAFKDSVGDRKKTIGDQFTAVATVAGDRWENIDLEEFARELRD